MTTQNPAQATGLSSVGGQRVEPGSPLSGEVKRGGNWNPRPRTDLATFSRRAYLAGYSDGFYGYRFGSGDQGAFGAFSDYRPGYAEGTADGKEEEAALLRDGSAWYSDAQREEMRR